MLRVDLPSLSVEEVFKTCYTGVQNPGDLEGRLAGNLAYVLDRSNAYLFAAVQGKCALLDKDDFPVPGVTKDEMVWLYDRRFAAKSSNGRRYYNDLKIGARDGLCCLCGFREAGTLDHYLQKTAFTALAVNPFNLLPACWACNHGKGSSSEDTVHPYFDDFHLDTWLQAEVIEVLPCVIDYTIDFPASWDAGLRSRATSRFNAFDLASLYSAQAARHLAGISLTLTRNHAEMGPEAVRRLLVTDRDSWCAVDPNSWQSALYRALSDSDWFCGGGFAR